MRASVGILTAFTVLLVAGAITAYAVLPVTGVVVASSAGVLSERFGEFEDCASYARGAGRAAPAVSAVYESLVCGQSPAVTENGALITVPPGGIQAKEVEQLKAMRLPEGCHIVKITVCPSVLPPTNADNPGSNAGDHSTSPNGIDLAGAWCSRERSNSPELSTSIDQNGRNLTFHNEHGNASTGHVVSDGDVVAEQWEGGLHASVADGGRTLDWTNGSVWRKSTNCAN